MKDFYSTLHAHRSIRKYKPDSVPEELLNRVLEAGIRASSSGNMQSYSIIVSDELKLRQQLYRAHFEQDMLLEAPLLLTFCSDFNRMRKWLALREAPDGFTNFFSFMVGAIDAILVSQNIALAAEAEGLGICYMGTTLASAGEIGRILNCPTNVVPVAGFVMGYPNEVPPLRDRLPLNGLVHRNRYQDYSSERINEIYKDRDQKGWERYMSIPELKEMVAKAGCKNLAQVYTQLKYTKESHEFYSEMLRVYLAEQEYSK